MIVRPDESRPTSSGELDISSLGGPGPVMRSCNVAGELFNRGEFSSRLVEYLRDARTLPPTKSALAAFGMFRRVAESDAGVLISHSSHL
jgi:hypothetical protein